MPIDCEIDAERGWLRTFWSGEVGDTEFLACYMAVLDDPKMRNIRKELADLSGVSAIDLTAAAMRKMAEEGSRYLGSETMKTSVYAPTDSAFGQARMYFVYADDAGAEIVNVFRSLKEAEDWLDE